MKNPFSARRIARSTYRLQRLPLPSEVKEFTVATLRLLSGTPLQVERNVEVVARIVAESLRLTPRGEYGVWLTQAMTRHAARALVRDGKLKWI